MTTITITGNVTRDPELRYTSNGTPVTNLTVAVTERTKKNGEWVDDGTTFYGVSVFSKLAENVAAGVTKGQRVIVTGEVRTRMYESNGQQRLSVDVKANDVGGSLMFAGASRPAPEGGNPWDTQGQAEAPF